MLCDKSLFDRDGFVVLRGFLEPEEVTAFSSRIQSYIEEVVPRLPPEDVYYEDKSRPETLKQLGRLEQHDPYFAALSFRDRITQLAERLLDGPVVAKGLQWFNKPPRVGQATPPHQDGYFFMLEPNEAVTLWLSLDVADLENGCVRYVPGSHRRGLRPHGRTSVLGFSQAIMDYGPDDRSAEFPVLTRPGDLIVHHSLTIHRADANTSDRHRRAVGINFYSARAREDAERLRAYRQMLDAELAAARKI